MATVSSQDVISRIVKHGILKLETKAGRTPENYGIVMTEGMVLTIDYNACNIQFYDRHDGKLISSHILESVPFDVCLLSNNEAAVCLNNSTIVILSLKSIYNVTVVQTLKPEFRCHSLAKLNSYKLVVSGWKKGDKLLCWGIVSIRDGRTDSTHVICEGILTHVAIKDNTVYISCRTKNGITEGVYAYDIFKPEKQKFLYQHKELEIPWSVMADRDFVYVCDRLSNRIHQLTDSGQLVTIHTVSSDLLGIFYDDQQGLLYTTNFESNVITIYKMESLYQSGKSN